MSESKDKIFNYIRLRNPITDIFYHSYAYIDSKDYMADRIFDQKGIRVKFYKWELCKGSWVVVKCRVRKKYAKDFEKSMDILSQNIALLTTGWSDYVEICNLFESIVRKTSDMLSESV